MSLRTADYDFELPGELIAKYPAPSRDQARMMVLDRATGAIQHCVVRDFSRFLRPGDLTVLNNTRVIPARLFSDDGRIEIFLLEATTDRSWKCLVKPGRKMRIGAVVSVAGISARVLDILPEGERIVEFERPLDLDRVGKIPLPPYMERPAEEQDAERYQTVFAAAPGAVAAPTAGLHFTKEMLEAVPHAFVTLHVGPGTFKPVSVESITDHPMHTEKFEVSQATVDACEAAKRVIAVGTTTVRVLESLMAGHDRLRAGAGQTDIFIYPPYRFRAVGALLTNFHLPKSTLLMLVSAFAGREFILRAYQEAIASGYRFYSYGDCMLIL